MRHTLASHLVLAVLLFACSFFAQAGVFKCADSAGRTVFQDIPCAPSTGTKPAADSSRSALKVQLLIVASKSDIGHWVRTSPQMRTADSERIRRVRRGMTILIPIVVTDFKPDASGAVRLSTELQLVNAAGAVVLARKESAPQNPDPLTPGLIVLSPIFNITSKPADPLGSYKVRVTVSDGARSAQAEESFTLIQ